MQKPKIVRTRNRLRDAENISRRQEIFENSTSRQPFQFERVVMKTAADDETIAPNIKRVIDRADPAPVREKRGRGGKKNRKKGRVGSRGGRRKRSAANPVQD